VWLAATRLGLALAPMSGLLDRRGWELGRALGASPTRLVTAFRLGRSAPAPRSGRRAVARFTSFAALHVVRRMSAASGLRRGSS
jgi:hypothetical protein